MSSSDKDPIVAVATAPGRGGIGVVRVSGPALEPIVLGILSRTLVPRHATHAAFLDHAGRAIDDGIAIYFPAPHSYTGEDVLELQAHGGPVVLQMLVTRCQELGRAIGMRLAEPGEFTRRALLNDKLDLAQAEAVADLIEATTQAAARSAQASLAGEFSSAIHTLVDALIQLRMLVEATLDFPEEEIDFLKKADSSGQLQSIRNQLERVLDRASQGAILREGLKVVLAGRPNVGKSSLLNALAQAEVAIVTPIAGTTRDRVVQTIQIEGIALHIIDTAGLHETENQVERIGMARTWVEIEGADVVLNLRDAVEPDTEDDEIIAQRLPQNVALRIVMNKIDLAGEDARVENDRVYVSCLTGEGIGLLRDELLSIAGWHSLHEPVYLARDRHIEALRAAQRHLEAAAHHAGQLDRVIDLFAEELRLAQEELSRITGIFNADDLLGEIFSRFCIGK